MGPGLGVIGCQRAAQATRFNPRTIASVFGLKSSPRPRALMAMV